MSDKPTFKQIKDFYQSLDDNLHEYAARPILAPSRICGRGGTALHNKIRHGGGLSSTVTSLNNTREREEPYKMFFFKPVKQYERRKPPRKDKRKGPPIIIIVNPPKGDTLDKATLAKLKASNDALTNALKVPASTQLPLPLLDTVKNDGLNLSKDWVEKNLPPVVEPVKNTKDNKKDKK